MGGLRNGKKNMGFVMCLASSKYENAYPAFPKEYGFPYHLTPEILKEIITVFARKFSSMPDDLFINFYSYKKNNRNFYLP